MIEPGHDVLDGLDGRYLGQRRAPQQDDGKAKRPRGRDLAVGRSATAVLGDDDVNGMRDQQGPIVHLRERTTAGDIGGVRYGERRINRFDAAHEIMMLRRSREDSELGLAKREKHTARRFAERVYRCRGIRHLDPTVGGQRCPRRATQREQGDACGGRRGGCIGGNDGSVRMRGVDQGIDTFPREIPGKTLGSAESADSHRHRVSGGRPGAACERHRCGHIAAFAETLRQPSRFRGAAQNEDAPHVGR